MTDVSIGAGTISHVVNEKKIPVKSEDIGLHLNGPIDVVNMAFGWLVRDNFTHCV